MLGESVAVALRQEAYHSRRHRVAGLACIVDMPLLVADRWAFHSLDASARFEAYLGDLVVGGDAVELPLPVTREDSNHRRRSHSHRLAQEHSSRSIHFVNK